MCEVYGSGPTGSGDSLSKKPLIGGAGLLPLCSVFSECATSFVMAELAPSVSVCLCLSVCLSVCLSPALSLWESCRVLSTGYGLLSKIPALWKFLSWTRGPLQLNLTVHLKFFLGNCWRQESLQKTSSSWDSKTVYMHSQNLNTIFSFSLITQVFLPERKQSLITHLPGDQPRTGGTLRYQ